MSLLKLGQLDEAKMTDELIKHNKRFEKKKALKEAKSFTSKYEYLNKDLQTLDNERLETLETIETVHSDANFNLTQKNLKIAQIVKNANLTGIIDKIEILDP